ncbi:MAG: hypothetical protein JSU69_11700 [Candidatus Zixiibacteriota bacterium]|nr:MAG: hypothetical protein JSU69_11700 [candidate division Zixibacteria bacterium]
MTKRRNLLQTTSVILLFVYLHSVILPGLAFGQQAECEYDRDNPTLESARKNFLALNYHCAEQEINDFLAVEGISIEERADGHVLLAEVYYARGRDVSEKKEKVIAQFVAAFEAYREWRGELNIKSPEFMAMMKEAQDLVDKQAAEEAAAVEEKPEEVVPAEVPKKEEKKKKPWYTKWWAIGLGVGVVVGGAVLLAGGGGDDGGPIDQTLPDFPPPPTKR